MKISLRSIGLHAVVGREGLSDARGPEHRFAPAGIGLGEVVAEQFPLPIIVIGR